MDSLAKQLAILMASTDGIPRVIRQVNDVYLVTPAGEVWRVYDSGDDTGATRVPATADATVSHRVFVGNAPRSVVRVYRFLDTEDRSVSAERLLEQLGESRASEA